MDGIALLCNLHAGGPQTLRRLRSAGIRRLDELAAMDEFALARLLEASPVGARRFAREARLLAQRLHEEPLEIAPPPAPREVLVELHPSPRLQPIPSRPVDAVEHARVAVRTTPPRPAAPERSAPPPRAPDTLLRPGLLEGLSNRVCERLIGQGVRTLEDLQRTANLNLARRIALSYPKLLDLTHEARKYLQGAPRVGSGPAKDRALERPDVTIHSAAPPPVQEAGAAGPFA